MISHPLWYRYQYGTYLEHGTFLLCYMLCVRAEVWGAGGEAAPLHGLRLHLLGLRLLCRGALGGCCARPLPELFPGMTRACAVLKKGTVA